MISSRKRVPTPSALHLKDGRFYAKLDTGGRRVWAVAKDGVFQA
jgi:hypothetical protein